LGAGVARLSIVNRTPARAEALAEVFGGRVQALPMDGAGEALETAAVLINASAAGLDGDDVPILPLSRLVPPAVVMDMVYKPLKTPLLNQAERLGLSTVDGLEMLIGQARPSFEAFFGRPPPEGDGARHGALQSLNAFTQKDAR
jgi:shikimate dehydrogenase